MSIRDGAPPGAEPDLEQRIAMHSGDYVQLLDSIPIDRLARLVPLLELRPDDRVVDFAAGTGVLAHLVADRVASYDGVDFSPDFVAFARRRASDAGLANAKFHCRDIVDFCAEHADEFDLVTAMDFSEHVGDEDFLRIFSGAHRILKPGGRLVVYTPNLDFFYERMKAAGLAKQFPQHIAVRTDMQH
ncbi:MAG TPA: class I SAM-dependent methyltransferase, partial [Xanthomonadales bacterium]|nr:class I SAM-dependent methyltransferase [Xanthomonadales bacterium]